MENGVINGGMGTAVIEFLSDNGFTDNRVFRIGIEDEFITHGSVKELHKIAKIDDESVLQKIIEIHQLQKQTSQENQNIDVVLITNDR